MLDDNNNYTRSFKNNQRLDSRNIINTTKNTLQDYTVKTTNPNKNSKNRSRSGEYNKSQRSYFTKTSIKKLRVHSLDLRREKDDPHNDYVRDEIERVIHFHKQVEQLNSEFNQIEK